MGKTVSNGQELNTVKSIEKVAQAYDKLHQKVDATTNENILLSDEEYAEYLDISNQIADQFPSLIQGWDDQGNAILNVGTSANSTEQDLMRLYEAAKLAANVSIGDNIQDSYDGYAA